jgi:hypothetical protein
MSKYNDYKTQFKDVKTLCEALKEMGYAEVEVHDKPVNLVGYHGDLRDDMAEVIIRRKFVGSASNDIGFKRQPDGTYKAIISEYDSGRHGTQWLNKLADNYCEKKVISIASKQRLRFLTKKTKDGAMVIQFLAQ